MAEEFKNTLIIVESPAKATTIEKYLGSGFKVKASMGHLIDLPKSRIAIDVDNNFEPEYITVRGKAKTLKELVTLAKKADRVFLASDNDREGEAIAYHLNNAILQKDSNKLIQRIVFNEITPTAINNSVKNPTEIAVSKVDAQKGRRVLDRLVGYNLSPVLWKKVKNGLSAGRVQSVALRLICEREAEVEKFIPQEYWTLDVDLQKNKSNFNAAFFKYKELKETVNSKEELDVILEEIKNNEFIVQSKDVKEKQQKPKAPFTTSTLQQTAANRLGWTSKKIMQVAQQLYEGVNIGATRVGLITYMRTDSTRISDLAIADVRKFIEKEFPADLPSEPIIYMKSQKAQDAHEAIRVTYSSYTPKEVEQYLTKDQFKLYSLIWERFVSSQMSNSELEVTSYVIKAGEALFKCSNTKIIKKGFQSVLKLLKSKDDEENGSNKKVPVLQIDEKLTFIKHNLVQHWTQGPARFTDASIVKVLEEKGIGRPSTYAPIISVLLDRYYITRKNKQLMPTVLGKIISEILVREFSQIINVDFTAKLESELDKVESSELDWHLLIKDFYGPFKKRIDEVNETLESIKGVLDEPTDEVCEKCGKPMVKKLGKYGFFLACSGFPDCKTTASVPIAPCPKCKDGKIVVRKKAGKGGREFYGCNKYPECDYVSFFKPTNIPCPKCGELMVEKEDKRNGIYNACINENCDYSKTTEEDK